MYITRKKNSAKLKTQTKKQCIESCPETMIHSAKEHADDVIHYYVTITTIAEKEMSGFLKGLPVNKQTASLAR